LNNPHLEERLEAEERSEFLNKFTTLEEHIEEQINRLRRAHLEFNGWRDVVDGGDSTNSMTARDIFNIRTKARYLSIVLAQSLESYHCENFNSVCKKIY
jgi:hypothetical protein